MVHFYRKLLAKCLGRIKLMEVVGWHCMCPSFSNTVTKPGGNERNSFFLSFLFFIIIMEGHAIEDVAC